MIVKTKSGHFGTKSGHFGINFRTLKNITIYLDIWTMSYIFAVV